MKLVRENGCAENYKPCGILDTIGNILCIDEEYDCPINEMIVDLSSKKNKYLALNYEMGVIHYIIIVCIIQIETLMEILLLY